MQESQEHILMLSLLFFNISLIISLEDIPQYLFIFTQENKYSLKRDYLIYAHVSPRHPAQSKQTLRDNTYTPRTFCSRIFVEICGNLWKFVLIIIIRQTNNNSKNKRKS